MAAPGDVPFVPLPYYARLTDPRSFLPGVLGTLKAFWQALAGIDCICLFGPHPLAFPIALMAWARGKKVVLGVRQDTPEYVRSRHPDRKLLHRIARLMDGGYRFLGRFCSVIAVGPAVAANYGRSRRLLQISVSLVDAAEHTMQVRRDGELLATVPITAGSPKNTTYNGKMVVSEMLERSRQIRRVEAAEDAHNGVELRRRHGAALWSGGHDAPDLG